MCLHTADGVDGRLDEGEGERRGCSAFACGDSDVALERGCAADAEVAACVGGVGFGGHGRDDRNTHAQTDEFKDCCELRGLADDGAGGELLLAEAVDLSAQAVHLVETDTRECAEFADGDAVEIGRGEDVGVERGFW